MGGVVRECGRQRCTRSRPARRRCSTRSLASTARPPAGSRLCQGALRPRSSASTARPDSSDTDPSSCPGRSPVTHEDPLSMLLAHTACYAWKSPRARNVCGETDRLAALALLVETDPAARVEARAVLGAPLPRTRRDRATVNLRSAIADPGKIVPAIAKRQQTRRLRQQQHDGEQQHAPVRHARMQRAPENVITARCQHERQCMPPRHLRWCV